MSRSARVAIALAAAAAVIAGAGQGVVHACTAFCAFGGGHVLVGNNEDFNRPHTKLWFVPAKPGSYGRMYVGFDDLWPQGGMNERGLWFDGFAAPPVRAVGSAELPSFRGNIIDRAMAECTTVDEVVQLFGRYNRAFLREAILMFADASGDAVSIEPNAIVRKTGAHFVQTNFHQSRGRSGGGDDRFATASAMLEEAGGNISVDLFRRILDATHQEGPGPTLYSNVYDLTARTMRLYYFHDFEHAVTFDLAEELKKGAHVLDIPALFPRNAAAETYAATRAPEPGGPPPAAIVAVCLVMLAAALGLAIYACVRGGRRGRVGVGAAVALAAACAIAVALTLGSHPPPSARWLEFSIGPASGTSAWINTSGIRANGLSLKGALATAYDVPAVRISGPPWLDDARYSVNAVVDLDTEDAFRSMLRQELESRFGLETHVDRRPFDIFVLTAADATRLERATSRGLGIVFGTRDVWIRNATMRDVAGALQLVLGKPVVDETGLDGTYNLRFEWTEDRAASVSAAVRDRFGLRLAPGRRDMEVLVVDRIRRDPSMLLLAGVSQATRAAPAVVRQRVAELLTIR